MYHTLKEFTDEYKMESQSTLKLLNVLTTESLYKTVDGKVRSIGRLSYHIAHTISEMMSKTGLDIQPGCADIGRLRCCAQSKPAGAHTPA